MAFSARRLVIYFNKQPFFGRASGFL